MDCEGLPSLSLSTLACGASRFRRKRHETKPISQPKDGSLPAKAGIHLSFLALLSVAFVSSQSSLLSLLSPSAFDAINRHLAHYSYHVGQIVYLVRMRRGGDWQTLSIARGASREYKPNRRD